MRPIDADALKAEILENYGRQATPDGLVRSEVWEILMMLYEAPTLDVAPVVHAKWVGRYADKDEGQGPCDFYRCSNCGMNFYCDKYSKDIFADFCPDCGAKMTVELEDCEEDDPQTL